MLQRQPQESSSNFRKRKTCSSECRRQGVVVQWENPVTRARLQRGLHLSQNTEEHVHRARKHMQAMRQTTQFIAAQRQRRLLTAEQIKTIRAADQPIWKLAAEYGLHRKTISGIRSGRYYADV